MRDSIHIVYGTDDNYIFPTAVSAASAIYFAKDRSLLVLHLFDAGVSDEHYAEYERMLRGVYAEVRLERHKLDASMFAGFGEWKGSVVTYSRMFIAELMPSVDWAIYIDGDTLWLGDPAELWALKDETMLVQASVDPPAPREYARAESNWYSLHGLEMDMSSYLCMGLMLANLKKMRDEHIPEQCREFMSSFPMPRVVDQTVLNYVCREAKAPLPANWGVFSAWHKDVDLSKPSIVHYCRDVPWARKKLNQLFSDVGLIWFAFCREVLGLDELNKFSLWTRFWRRGMFVILKHCQWVVRINWYVHARLRNTHGIPTVQMAKILEKLKCE